MTRPTDASVDSVATEDVMGATQGMPIAEHNLSGQPSRKRVTTLRVIPDTRASGNKAGIHVIDPVENTAPPLAVSW